MFTGEGQWRRREHDREAESLDAFCWVLLKAGNSLEKLKVSPNDSQVIFKGVNPQLSQRGNKQTKMFSRFLQGWNFSSYMFCYNHWTTNCDYISMSLQSALKLHVYLCCLVCILKVSRCPSPYIWCIISEHAAESTPDWSCSGVCSAAWGEEFWSGVLPVFTQSPITSALTGKQINLLQVRLSFCFFSKSCPQEPGTVTGS